MWTSTPRKFHSGLCFDDYFEIKHDPNLSPHDWLQANPLARNSVSSADVIDIITDVIYHSLLFSAPPTPGDVENVALEAWDVGITLRLFVIDATNRLLVGPMSGFGPYSLANNMNYVQAIQNGIASSRGLGTGPQRPPAISGNGLQYPPTSAPWSNKTRVMVGSVCFDDFYEVRPVRFRSPSVYPITQGRGPYDFSDIMEDAVSMLTTSTDPAAIEELALDLWADGYREDLFDIINGDMVIQAIDIGGTPSYYRPASHDLYVNKLLSRYYRRGLSASIASGTIIGLAPPSPPVPVKTGKSPKTRYYHQNRIFDDFYRVSSYTYQGILVETLPNTGTDAGLFSILICDVITRLFPQPKDEKELEEIALDLWEAGWAIGMLDISSSSGELQLMDIKVAGTQYSYGAITHGMYVGALRSGLSSVTSGLYLAGVLAPLATTANPQKAPEGSLAVVPVITTPLEIGQKPEYAPEPKQQPVTIPDLPAKYCAKCYICSYPLAGILHDINTVVSHTDRICDVCRSQHLSDDNSY